MIIRIIILLGFSLIFNACNGQQKTKTIGENVEKRTFEMVSVPSIITAPDERADYLAKHYWDKFDFTDTTTIHLPDITEQAMTNFLDIMKYVKPETASVSIKSMLNKAEVDSTMFAYITGLYEKYLYDPNSPMRNEELYIYVLEAMVNSSILDDINKIRPSSLLELALKNRVGEPAADFTYTLANGQNAKMSGIKANYLLLFFNNPDCHACKEITDQMAASKIINQQLKQSGLKILCLYPDEDLEAWRNHLSYMPAAWINSYDKSLSLRNNEVYDLKAIPTLYLLDKDKKVLLKDVTFNQIEDYLQTQMK